MCVRLEKEVFRCDLDVVGLVVWYSVAFQVGSFLLMFSLLLDFTGNRGGTT